MTLDRQLNTTRMVTYFFLLCLLFGTAVAKSIHENAATRSQRMIEAINKMNTTWKAGYNFGPETTAEEIKTLLGVLPRSTRNAPRLPALVHQIPKSLPDIFDSRLEWPNCPTIKDIHDQAACGSSWAMGAVEAMSDRICIHSNGKNASHLSAEDLISCCHSCGDGCNGGHPDAAWQYWASVGIVTGGDYNSNEGCQPYKLPPCDHYIPDSHSPCRCKRGTPACETSCRPGYEVSYEDDKVKGARAYSIYGDQEQIKTEIMTNGPVEVSFTVYEDFFYKSGVYSNLMGEILGLHAARMLGWGVENGTPYWLVANSWNTNWGDQGFFKIRRGHDECAIENDVNAGTPF